MAASITGCRRQTVTVLFVDIVGFTALIHDLDCADVRELQVEYFDAVSAVVRSCGGVVEKYIGDAVMAMFGAYEGDGLDVAAAAGVRAGMEVQTALRGRRLAGRFPVRTRVGLATGDVIIDDDAARAGGYGMISGSVVSTAARLQAYAPHDTVVVDAATRRATDKLIAYQELPPVAVAGKPDPLDLWRALHPQAAPCRTPCTIYPIRSDVSRAATGSAPETRRTVPVGSPRRSPLDSGVPPRDCAAGHSLRG